MLWSDKGDSNQSFNQNVSVVMNPQPITTDTEILQMSNDALDNGRGETLWTTSNLWAAVSTSEEEKHSIHEIHACS